MEHLPFVLESLALIVKTLISFYQEVPFCSSSQDLWVKMTSSNAKGWITQIK